MAMPNRRSFEKLLPVSITTDTLFRILFIAVGAALVYYLWNVVLIFLVALLLSALIDPFADALEAKRIARGFAVGFIYLVILAAGVGVSWLVIPSTIHQVDGLVEMYGDEFAFLGIDTSFFDTLALEHIFDQDFTQLILNIQNLGMAHSLPALADLVFNTFNGVITVIIVAVLAFYMSIEERELKKGVILWLTPAKYRDLMTDVMPKVRRKLGFWLRGQITIMIIVGVLVFTILTILGVPFALVLALTAALLEIIPFIGPFLSVVPALVVGFSVSPLLGGLVALAYLLIQQLEGNVITPNVMQKVAGLNPIASIMAILIGWELAGIAGALFALPIAMVIGLFLSEWFKVKEQTEKKSV